MIQMVLMALAGAVLWMSVRLLWASFSDKGFPEKARRAFWVVSVCALALPYFLGQQTQPWVQSGVWPLMMGSILAEYGFQRWMTPRPAPRS